jgi:hypothetical protein
MLPYLVNLAPVFDEVHDDLLLTPVDSVEGSITANPQLEQAFPLASQWFRRNCLEILCQLAELVEDPLGYWFVQTGEIIPGLRHPLQVVHATTPGQVGQLLPGQECL